MLFIYKSLIYPSGLIAINRRLFFWLNLDLDTCRSNLSAQLLLQVSNGRSHPYAPGHMHAPIQARRVGAVVLIWNMGILHTTG